MTYRGAADDRPRQRTVDPYGLIENGGRWYLLARHRGVTKTYRVGRVARVSGLDATFERPDGFDLDAEWERRRAGFEQPTTDAVALELRCNRDAQRHVRRVCQPMLASGTTIDTHESDDESVLMRCTFRVRKAAVGMLLAFAGEVEVLAPADLRAELRETALAAAATYGA